MEQNTDNARNSTQGQWKDVKKGGLAANDIEDVDSSVKALKSFISKQRTLLTTFEPLEEFAEVLKNGKPEFIDTNQVQPGMDSAQVKAVSPLTEVEVSLERIASSHQKDLVWTSVFSEEAKQRALQLEKKAEDNRGLLYGYTIGLKDMIAKTGHISGWGAKVPVMEQAAEKDATVVEKLKMVDAVILGTLHMAEFALSPTGLNEWYGTGRSPINEEYISGGSSSGSGMAVGAAHATATIGSDTGGSIRLPAACCGVVGLKPTQGLVSVNGVMPLSPSLDCIGPLARSVSECANVFFALTATDNQVLSPKSISIENTAAKDCVIAIPSFSANSFLSDAMCEVLQEVEREFRELGVKVIKVPLPDLDCLGMLASIVLSVEATSYHYDRLENSPELYGRQVLRRLVRGFGLNGIDYFDAIRLRGPALKKFLETNLQGAHALLLPTLPDAPPLVSQTINKEQSVLEKEFSALSWWTRGINYLGVPSLSMPVNTTKSPMPLSIQLVGAPYGEINVLRIARLLERHLNLSIQQSKF